MVAMKVSVTSEELRTDAFHTVVFLILLRWYISTLGHEFYLHADFG